MNIKPLYQKISMSHIDLNDLTFSLTPVAQDEISDRLRDSVAKCGIIHPPLLTTKGNREFIIVAGRQRLLAARQILGSNCCDCLLLPAGTSPAILLTMALQDILLTRPATPVEKAICWQKAVAFLGSDTAGKEFGPQLELTRQLTPTRLAEIQALDSEMQLALHKGQLELKTAFKLLDFDRTDRETLFKIIQELRLSSSNQRKLVDSCLELSRRHSQKITTVLSDPDCSEIINHPEANPPQKAALLMSWLNGLCHPRLTEAEKEFRRFVGQLKLPRGVALEHTTSFEQDTVLMTVEFPDRRQLTEKWPNIREAIAGSSE